ncbi:MAG: hypothetical protein IKG77_10600 [Prevotella sp.]|nr:hypothetical protein [Prevotella sp.]
MRIQNDKQQIAQLLSKFMAGETSLAEEQLLAQYFRTHDVREEWAEYKQMFALFDSGEVDIEVKAKPKLVALRWIVAAVAASVLLLLDLRLGQRPEDGTIDFYVGKAVSKLQTPPPTPPLEGRGVLAESLAANKAAAAPLPSRGGAGVGSVITVEEVPAVQYTASVVQPTPQPVKQQKRAIRSAPTPAKASPSTSKEGDVKLHDPNRSSASLSNQAPPPLEGRGEAFNRQDPFLLAVAQTQDIRQRGERLHREIAQLMNNP